MVDGYNIYSGYHGHYCVSNPYFCGDVEENMMSGFNKHNLEDQTQQEITQILHLVLTLLSIPFFAYCRAYYYKANQFLTRLDITDDDFSIGIERVPTIIRPMPPERPARSEEEQRLRRDEVFYDEDLNRNVFDFLKDFFNTRAREVMMKEKLEYTSKL